MWHVSNTSGITISITLHNQPSKVQEFYRHKHNFSVQKILSIIIKSPTFTFSDWQNNLPYLWRAIQQSSLMYLTTYEYIYEPRHDKTKMSVRPAKTQISLGTRPVWSVFAVRMKKPWILSYPLNAQRRLIKLSGCPGWSESSLGAHSFCWFCHIVADIFIHKKTRRNRFLLGVLHLWGLGLVIVSSFGWVLLVDIDLQLY